MKICDLLPKEQSEKLKEITKKEVVSKVDVEKLVLEKFIVGNTTIEEVCEVVVENLVSNGFRLTEDGDFERYVNL